MNKKELAFSKLAQNCRPLTPEEMEQVSGGNQHYTIRYPTTHVTGTRINQYTTTQAAAYYSSGAFYASIGVDLSTFVQAQFEPDTNENENDPSPDDGIEGIEVVPNDEGGFTVTVEQNGFFDILEPIGEQFPDNIEETQNAGTTFNTDPNASPSETLDVLRTFTILPPEPFV